MIYARQIFEPGDRVQWGKPRCVKVRGTVVDDAGGEHVQVKSDEFGGVERWIYEVDGIRMEKMKGDA